MARTPPSTSLATYEAMTNTQQTVHSAGPFRPLTDDEMHQLSVMRALALSNIDVAYFASMVYKFRPVACDYRQIVDTLAVDQGLRLYLNFDSMREKVADGTASWATFGEALVHEVGHIVQSSSKLAEELRIPRDSQHQKMWNVAADMAINDGLRDAGCSALAQYGVFAASIGCQDHQVPMVYYRKLQELIQDQDPDDSDGQGQDSGDQDQDQDQGSDGQGEDSEDQSDPSQDGQGSGDQDQDQDSEGQSDPSQDGQGQQKLPPDVQDAIDRAGDTPYAGCGSVAGNPSPVEMPAEGSQDSDGDEYGDAASDYEIKEAVEQVARDMEQWAQKNRGTQAADEIADLAAELLKPTRTPWEKILASFVSRSVRFVRGGSRETYINRSRRLPSIVLTDKDDQGHARSTEVLLPGRHKPIPSVHLIRDTSGSMGWELEVVGREVATLARRLNISGDDLLVTDVDTEVHATVPFRDAASIRKVHGRGGTDMCEGIEAVAAYDHKGRTPICVVATDGGTPWPPAPPRGIGEVVALLITDEKVDTVKEWNEQSIFGTIPSWIHTVIVHRDELERD